MSELKECPKCGGSMTAGALQKIGNYGNPPYVWAPHDDAPFPVKGVVSKRRSIVVYCCDRCGHLELYAPATTA